MASILGIDTIQHQSGTTAMTIDNSGRVLTPARPSFFAHRRGQGNQSLSSNTNTLVQFNQLDHNIGSHFDTSTYKFTCPVSGVYHFDMSLYIYSASQSEARFYINDASKYRFASVKLGAERNPLSAGGGVTVQLSANDTVSVYAMAIGSSLAVYDGSASESASMFSGYLVG